MSPPVTDVAQAIETVEAAYEFMLAYAAQGRSEEIEEPEGIRGFLQGAEIAIARLAKLRPGDIRRLDSDDATARFLAVVGADAARASAIISFVLGQPSISSQIIDNLNASIHIRTLLTDLFVLDEGIKRN